MKIRKAAAYLMKLSDADYGVAPTVSSAVNYLIDSYFSKLASMQEPPPPREYIPADPSAHVKEIWLGCEIHKTVIINRSYPGFARSLNAYAFAMLFSPFGGEMSPYTIVPFLDTYKFREMIKGSYEWKIQQEGIKISLDECVTLPVYGTFFVRCNGTNVNLVVKIDLCYESSSCVITVISNPSNKKDAEAFLEDFESSRVANDIYYNKCLTFTNGALDFIGVTPSSWDEIILKDDFKDTIRQNTVGVLQNHEALTDIGMTPNRNVMLISPPGMAKTTIFRAITQEIAGQMTVIWCTGKSIGQAKDVTSLFEAARSLSPCIIFIEDMDLFGRDRSSGLYGSDSHILNEFLACLDGAQENSGIVVMASTNDLDSMDEALVNRPGRFDVKVDIPFPDAEDRLKMLSSFLSMYKACPDSTVTRDTIHTIVNLTEGLTGAYIKDLAKTTVIRAVAKGRSGDGQVTITSDDLTAAADQVVKNFTIGKRAKRHHNMEADISIRS